MTALGRLVRTTAFKLSAIYMAAFVALAAFLILYISHTTDQILRTQLDDAISGELADLTNAYRAGGAVGLVRLVDYRSRRPGASLYLVTDFAGNALAGNVSDLSPTAFDAVDGHPRPVRYRRFSREDGTAAADRDASVSHVALVSVFVLPGGFRVLVGRDISEQEKFSAVVTRSFRLVGVVVIVLGLMSWLFIGRRVLKRIDSISQTSARIMSGDLTGRLEVLGKGDEFDRLAEGLNAMLDRIEHLMNGLKEVSDNIAHDLKTPLTRLRNRVETALRDATTPEAYRVALEDTIKESDQLIRTFNALLMIARAEAGSSEGQMGEIDLTEIAAGIVELYEPVAEKQGVQLTLEPGPQVLFTGNRELIGQALSNLIDNAIKYGRSARDGGREPRIQVDVTKGADMVRLAVADNGAGVREEDYDLVLSRFGRLEKSRTEPGSGLGLSLARAVAQLHHGQVRLARNNPGLAVTLELPLDGYKGAK